MLAANVAGPGQHCPTMIVSPRGEVVAEASPGAAAILRATLDLGRIRDAYLSQQRGDVVSIGYPPV